MKFEGMKFEEVKFADIHWDAHIIFQAFLASLDNKINEAPRVLTLSITIH